MWFWQITLKKCKELNDVVQTNPFPIPSMYVNRFVRQRDKRRHSLYNKKSRLCNRWSERKSRQMNIFISPRLIRNNLFLKLNCSYETGGEVETTQFEFKYLMTSSLIFLCDRDNFDGRSEWWAMNRLECYYGHKKLYTLLRRQRHRNKSR